MGQWEKKIRQTESDGKSIGFNIKFANINVLSVSDIKKYVGILKRLLLNNIECFFSKNNKGKNIKRTPLTPIPLLSADRGPPNLNMISKNMSENVDNIKDKTVSRRNFLKMLGVGVSALVLNECKTHDDIPTDEPQISEVGIYSNLRGLLESYSTEPIFNKTINHNISNLEHLGELDEKRIAVYEINGGQLGRMVIGNRKDGNVDFEIQGGKQYAILVYDKVLTDRGANVYDAMDEQHNGGKNTRGPPIGKNGETIGVKIKHWEGPYDEGTTHPENEPTKEEFIAFVKPHFEVFKDKFKFGNIFNTGFEYNFPDDNGTVSVGVSYGNWNSTTRIRFGWYQESGYTNMEASSYNLLEEIFEQMNDVNNIDGETKSSFGFNDSERSGLHTTFNHEAVKAACTYNATMPYKETE